MISGLGARVRFSVDVEQLRRVDVRVSLRRAQTRVAEELLDGAQVGAALQEVRRERVPERVRADAEPRTGGRHVAPYEPIDAPRAERGAAIVDEERNATPASRRRGSSHELLAIVEIRANR